MLTGWYTTRCLLGVVAHLDIADQREILAERMADEAVVGEQAAQVRMIRGTGCRTGQRPRARTSWRSAQIPTTESTTGSPSSGAPHPQPQALVVADRQQLVDHREARPRPRSIRRIGARHAPRLKPVRVALDGLPLVAPVDRGSRRRPDPSASRSAGPARRAACGTPRAAAAASHLDRRAPRQAPARAARCRPAARRPARRELSMCSLTCPDSPCAQPRRSSWCARSSSAAG